MIEGLTGTGKSGLALLIAMTLSSDPTKIAAIDTENKSLNLFKGLKTPNEKVYENFLIGQLTEDIGFKPSNYLAFRTVAKQQGVETVIFDSISHAWQYKGGVLDLVSQANSRMTRNDKYAAWGDEEVVKEKNELLQLIRDKDLHMITTVRVKEKMEYDKDAEGKTVLRSLGEQQIQQADLKYEPDLVLHMIEPGSAQHYPKARVIKTRYAFLEKDEIYEFTPALLNQLKVYLEDGVDPEMLLEQQRQEYIIAVKELLDSKPTLKAIWQVAKTDAGYKDTKLPDMPLDVLKTLYLQIN